MKALKGFTLVELLVVIGIIGILGSLSFVGINTSMTRAKNTVCISNLRQLGLQLQSFVSDHHRYPWPFASSETRLSMPGQSSSWISSIAPEELHVVTRMNDTNRLPKSIVLCPTMTKRVSTILSTGERTFVNGMYGYNVYGYRGKTSYNPSGLGLKILTDGDVTRQEAVAADDVAVPANMIALGDGVRGWNASYDDATLYFQRDILNFATPDSTSRVQRRHGGKLNAAFCDGHVTSYRLFDLFSSTNTSFLAMWNRDNQPH